MIKKIILLSLLSYVLLCSYFPEMFLTASADFFNKEISINAGPIVDKFIHDFKAPNVSIDKKIGLIHAKINLSNITQKAQINWHANILKVTGNRSFEIHAQNINVSIKSSDFSYHISSDKVGQHGELFIDLHHISSTVFSSFIRNNCSKGIGFGLSIN